MGGGGEDAEEEEEEEESEWSDQPATSMRRGGGGERRRGRCDRCLLWREEEESFGAALLEGRLEGCCAFTPGGHAVQGVPGLEKPDEIQGPQKVPLPI